MLKGRQERVLEKPIAPSVEADELTCSPSAKPQSHHSAIAGVFKTKIAYSQEEDRRPARSPKVVSVCEPALSRATQEDR